jgi:uncharacterized delta-60 repeat protein
VQLTLDVTAVNDAPTLSTLSTLTGASEDTGFTLTYAALAAAANEADVDLGDTLSFRVEALSTGTLTKGGLAVVPGTTLLASGESLVWTPAPNASGSALNAFTVVAWDGTAASATPVQLSVDVGSLNDAPTLTAFTSPAASVNEDAEQTLSLADLLAAGNEADVDGTVTAMVVKAVSSGSLRIGADATSATAWDALTNSTVDATHLAFWTPGANVFGSALNAFTVVAKDNAGLESATPVQLTLDVTAVNDAPTLSTLSTLTGASEDTGFTLTYAALAAAANEADVDLGDTLSFRVEALSTGTLTKGGLAVVPGTTLLASGESLVWTPAPNANGSALNAFTVVAWDGTAASATPVQLSVDVGSLNDAPTLTAFTSPAASVNEDAEQTLSLADLLAAGNEADVDGTVTAMVVKAVSSGSLRIGADATSATAWDALTNSTVDATHLAFWTPGANVFGSALNAFTVVAKDNAGLESATPVQLTLDVTAVNDAPTLSTLSTLTGASEDTGFTLTYAALAAAANEADVDLGDTLSFRVEALSTGTLTKGGLAVVPGTTLLASGESLVWTPAPNASGSALNAFTVVAWDGTAASATPVQLSVDVGSLNDAPTLGGVPVTAQAITTGQAAALADFTVADVDSTDLSLTLTATNGVINGLTDAYPATTGIQLSGTAEQINAAIAGATFTATAAGAASINLSLSDGTALAVTGSYNLTASLPLSSAPVLDSTASPALPSVLEGATNPTGITVAALVVDGSITDPDGTATEAIAITGLNTTLGSWQYSTDSGVNWLNIRADLINSSTNELALLLAPTDSVRLLPFGDLNGSLSNAITFRAWDMSTGTAGQYATIASTGGGSTAFSTVSDTASLVVTAVNDAPSFEAMGAGTGKLVVPVDSADDLGFSVIQQVDGRLVVAGQSVSGNNYDFSLIRLNADGSLDNTFGNSGKLLMPVGSTIDSGQSVIQQADGKLVVAGSSWNGNDWDFGLVRLNTNGSLDNTFGNSGKLLMPVGSAYDAGRSVIQQADGKLVVAGTSWNGSTDDFSLVRLNPNGSLDNTFGNSGKLLMPVGSAYDAGRSVIQQADGKLVVAGYSSNGNNYDFSLIRLNADGSLDNTFGNSGKLLIPVGSSDDYSFSVIQQADGKLVVAGYSSNGNNYDFSLIRLNADGSLDNTFGNSGKLLMPVGSAIDSGHSVIQQANGKLVVVGESWNGSNYDFSLVRLNTDGTLDTNFGNGGKLLMPVGSDRDDGWSVIQQADGKLVVAGYSSNGNNYDFSLIRLNADGSLDTSFAGTAANTLGGSASYTEGAAATVLDSSVALFDADLAALDNGAGNYAGASITLARTGGANAQDVFSATGALSFSGSDVLLSGVTVGTLTNAAGTLVITFNSNATQARVNQTLSAIGYSNSSDTPPASVQIDWTFSDGNAAAAQGTGGALTATGSTTVNITAANDAPTLGGVPVTAQAITTGQAAALADFTVADVDSTDLSLTLTATNGVINGLTDAYPATTGIQLSGTAEQINAAIAGATFTATAAGAASINLSLSDGTALAVTGSYNLTAANPVSQALNGTPGADTLTGTANNDTINGLAGNDTLSGGLGNDTLDGGADLDTASYASATGAVTAFLWSNQATGADGTDSLISIENLIGSGFADRLDGTNSANDLSGGAGADTLNAYAGADTLSGGAGNDTLDGGADLDTVSYASATGAVTVFLWGSQATGADGTDAVYNTENVIGSGFADRLDGTNSANDLSGGAGNDTLNAYAGADTLSGGAGNDTLDGGADLDTVSYASATGAVTVFLWGSQATGADGTDAVYNTENVIGSGFADRLDGTNSANALTGGAGNDSLYGYAGADTLTGGAGDDTLTGGADNDTFVYAASGAGIDTLTDLSQGDTLLISAALTSLSTGNGASVTGNAVQVSTSAGTTTLWIDTNNSAGAELQINLTGSYSASTLSLINNGNGTSSLSRTSALNLIGDASANTLTAAATDDTLSGLAGNDTLIAGAGNDLIDGGADLDTASYASATGAVTVFLWGGQATGADGNDALANIENLIGSGFADRLDGTNSANDLSGGAGADTLNAYAGADTLSGGAGNDTLDGGADLDTVSYASATGAVTVFLWGSQATGADGTDAVYNTENVIGSGFADRLDGTNSANDLSGGAGNDTLYGYAGNDTIAGGAGNDTLDGGADLDTVSYASATGAVTVFLWGSQATGADGTDAVYNTENVIGSGFADRLDGTNSANDLSGGAGNDTLYGYAGNDTIAGGAGNDTLDGGADLDTVSYASATGAVTVFLWGSQATGADGNDAVYNTENVIGSGFADRLDGTNSANDLSGGAGADSLYGYAGADTITGGAGNDLLDGGADADRFVFTDASGLDQLLNFSSAQGDKIYLKSGINGSSITTAAQALAHTSDMGGNATIDLGSGHYITLVGIATASLAMGDFVVA